ncbi:MAG: DUF177 domain-containing protein [Microcystaceae cyanobacterium]
MEAIYIPRLLKAPKHTEIIQIQDFITGIDTLSPVKGSLSIAHRRTYLEVTVQAKAILTLSCDRCLQQYNHRLTLDTSELLWLDKNVPEDETSIGDKELSEDNLEESLASDGYFDVYNWLYEQLSLAMPLRQLCGRDCQPPAISQPTDSLKDSRWSVLETLKNQLN